MKKNSKKGFTIVELVIVIAVIAILAGVLIPTFSTVIKKARINSDTQVVRNLNTSLAADEAVNGKPESFGDVIRTLKEDGYILANLNPTTDGWYYVWESESNQILLVDDQFNVYFKSKDLAKTTAGKTWHFAVATEELVTALESKFGKGTVAIQRTMSNTSDVIASLNAGGDKTLYIDEDIKYNSGDEALNVTSGNVTLDLANSEFTNPDSIRGIPMVVTGENTTLTLKDGTISAVGAVVSADGDDMNIGLQVKDKATLNIDGTTLNNTPDIKGTIVHVESYSTANLKNVNSTLHGSNLVNVNKGGKAVLENVNATGYDINEQGDWKGFGIVFLANTGDGNGADTDVTIKSGNYASYFIADMFHGSLNIEGGNFTYTKGNVNKDTSNGITLGGTDNVEFFNFYATTDVTVTITGGTFQGVDFADITIEQWTKLCRNRNNNKVIDVVTEEVNGRVTKVIISTRNK